MLNRLALALILIFGLAAGPAQAETVTARRDQYSATLEVPQGWEVRRMPTDPQGVVAALSPQHGAVFLGVGPMSTGGTDRSVREFVQGMGGTLSPNSRPTILAGRSARLYTARASLGGRPAEVRVTAVALDPTHIMMVACILFDGAAPASHSRTLAIASTARLVGAAAPARAR
jgi:hypothetical protein